MLLHGSFLVTAYLSHSEAIQHRLTHVNSHSSSREPILDEESRRLLNDSHLLINRDRLVLLDIIGQGACALCDHAYGSLLHSVVGGFI